MGKEIVFTSRPEAVPYIPVHLPVFTKKEDLCEANLEGVSRIYFPHWSWKIPAEIFNKYECIIFHMTDLPYGRGGSPLQNLIERGHTKTVLSAIRCVEEMDGGDIYLKATLDLGGTAEEIYLRAYALIGSMIKVLSKITVVPTPQLGEVTVFKRRKPEDSNLHTCRIDPYDFIRMLDATGYPKAFIDFAGYRCEFSGATKLDDGSTAANVRITKS